MIGCHSVMERPESVSRVAPPTRIMATIRAAIAASQMRSARSCLAGTGALSCCAAALWAKVEVMAGLIAAPGPRLNLQRPAPSPQPHMTNRSGRGHYPTMTARTRKLIGTIVFLLGLALYATAAAVIGSGRIALAPQWVQFAFFVTAGLAWVIPAGLLIRWMQRPD